MIGIFSKWIALFFLKVTYDLVWLTRVILYNLLVLHSINLSWASQVRDVSFTINSARAVEYILCIGHYWATSFLDRSNGEQPDIHIMFTEDLEPYLTWNCVTHHLVSSGMYSEVRVGNRVGMTAWSEQMVRDVEDIALQHRFWSTLRFSHFRFKFPHRVDLKNVHQKCFHHFDPTPITKEIRWWKANLLWDPCHGNSLLRTLCVKK